MKTKNNFSFIDKLSFEGLSLLLNDLSIMTHPMTNEQKVCVEYPNINIENKIFNILETKKDSDTISDEENDLSNKTVKNTLDNEYKLNISKDVSYIINPTKLYNEFNNIPYSIEEFKNSLKIFVSIFNCFNQDLFKWNLEDFNLFNHDNKIQIFNFNKEKNNIKIEESVVELYQKHFSIQFDYEKADIIEVYTSQNSNDSNLKTSNDNFEDDFELSYRISINNKNKIDLNLNNDNKDENLFCYEKDKIYRNIYFIMNFFNLLNNIILIEFNLDNILKNIDLLNSLIINDYKFLLLICFNITIQINIFINKVMINNFLNINNNINIANQNNTNNNGINDNKMLSLFNPKIYFLDYQNKEIANDENELIKEKIIFLNFILKLFNLTYFYKNNIKIKINIKILSIDFFHEIKAKLLFQENSLINFNDIIDFIKNNEFTELFNNSKNIFSVERYEQILLKDIDINHLNELTKIYYPFIINADFVSFDTMENDSLIKYPLINYLNELSILFWALKFIAKIAKLNNKKFAFSFIFNSFSIALKKDNTDKNYNINILDLMIYMGVYHYEENEFVKFMSEPKNFHLLQKKFKDIIKCLDEYKNYNIGVKLFKNGIFNKELQYYFISLILSLLNSINDNNNEKYKNIVLYENKFINNSKYIFLHIKTNNYQKEKINDIFKSQNDNVDIKNNKSISSSKRRKESKNNNLFGGLNMFNKNKKNNEEKLNNINNIHYLDDEIKVKKNEIIKETNQAINIFSKQLSNCEYISNLESNSIINYVKEIKNYFTDILFYIQISNKGNNNNDININDKKFDDFISFEPTDILRNFTNNKCFIILKEYSYIDILIYLYDLYENNIENSNKNKNKNEIFNEILKSLYNFKDVCNKNFISKKSSMVIGKVNFIIHKYYLILNQYFNDNKLFFNEENRIIILDKFTHTDLILDDSHISIILQNNLANKDKRKNNDEDYFVKFYSTFLYEYDVIKYIMDKKLLKFTKLNIIAKRKILQINSGQIQIKKINFQIEGNNKNLNKEKNIKNQKEKEEEETINNNEKKDDEIKDIDINNIYLDNNINGLFKYGENYNLFKIKQLFKYQNSIPLIIFFLQKETEISNLSFLLFSFSEIFLSKSNKEITKEIIIKRIIKFFDRFKSSKLTPIIFNKKYLLYFLNFFDKIIKKMNKSNSRDTNNSLINPNDNDKQIFDNIIFFPINYNILNNNISEEFSDNGIFNNLTKNVSIFQIVNDTTDIKYNINQVGKLFKIGKIMDTITELGKISTLNMYDKNNNIIIYKVDIQNLNNLLKKNQKRVKFVGINKDNKTSNIHVFNGNEILIKYKEEKNSNNNNNCLIY